MSWAAAIPLITAGIGLAGSLASKSSQQRAKGRETEAVLTQQGDRDRTSQYGVQQSALLQAMLMAENARLNRAKIGLEAPSARARQAAAGDILKNIQDVSISGVPGHIKVPQISGGLRPSLLGANARAAGAGLSSQALQALLSGSDMPEMPDISKALLAAPGFRDLPQAGKTDSLLNILSAIGAISEGGSQLAGLIPRGGGQPAPSSPSGAPTTVDPNAPQWGGIFNQPAPQPPPPSTFTQQTGQGMGIDPELLALMGG